MKRVKTLVFKSKWREEELYCSLAERKEKDFSRKGL